MSFFFVAVPENPLAFSNRSHVLHRLGQTAGSLSDAERVINLQPRWGKVNYK